LTLPGCGSAAAPLWKGNRLTYLQWSAVLAGCQTGNERANVPGRLEVPGDGPQGVVRLHDMDHARSVRHARCGRCLADAVEEGQRHEKQPCQGDTREDSTTKVGPGRSSRAEPVPRSVVRAYDDPPRRRLRSELQGRRPAVV